MFTLAFIGIAAASGAVAGIASFWVMFVLIEWMYAREEPKRRPRELGPDGYRNRRGAHPFGTA